MVALESMSTASESSSARDDEGVLYRSPDALVFPTVDIVSYAFEHFDKLDVDRPIFVDGSDPLSFISARKARKLVCQVVAGLRAQGLEDGDCVCIHASNNILYPVLWLGVIGAGGCVTGSNPAVTARELIHHFTVTKTRFVIAQESHQASAFAAAHECQIRASRFFVLRAWAWQPSDQPCAVVEKLLSCGLRDWKVFGRDESKSHVTTAVLGLTSGTTGRPKAAAISHRSLVAQCAMIEDLNQDKAPGTSQLICLPVFHAFAAPLSLILPLRTGLTTYFMPRFHLTDFVDIVHKFQVTDTAVVPLIITSLLKLPLEQILKLRSLNYVICAGAPMNAAVQKKLSDHLIPDLVIAQCWGTTETGWLTAFGRQAKDSSGSVGRLLANVELKILGDDGDVVSEGERGEACVRSPSLLLRYVDDVDATGRAIGEDGFYRTGDRAHVIHGKVFIDGRIKDTLKIKGWQVSPEELEDLLREHPDIADATVTGLTRVDEDGLQETRPHAFVVREAYAAEALNAEMVQDYVASRVITYKRLTGGVTFVDHISRNSTGKILRRLLPEPTLEPS